MTNNQLNPKVDEFLINSKKWSEEFSKLRNIILEAPLTEGLKWGVPCYTFDGKNVLLIHGFKEYCAVLFIKGSLLHDPQHILIQQTENVQAGRQLRFTALKEIIAIESVIKSYIEEAIDNEKAGLEVNFKKNTEFTIPAELQKQFDEVPNLKAVFDSLTPGRQNAYIFYFSAPKLPKTRETRVEKYVQQILDGKGLYD